MIKVPLKKNTPVSARADPTLTDASGADVSPYDIILGTVEIDTERIPIYMFPNPTGLHLSVSSLQKVLKVYVPTN